MEVVYFRLGGGVFGIEPSHADAIAARNPKCALAVQIFHRLATDSYEPVELDAPGYEADAWAAISTMYSEGSDSQQVSALREALLVRRHGH